MNKKQWIERELRDLGLSPSDPEYQAIFNQVIEFADIRTKQELTKLIEELYQ